jgi:cytochrome P450
MSQTIVNRPPFVLQPRGPLETLGILRRLVRNPMETWPPEVYTERLVRGSFLGRTTFFVCAPDLAEQVLVDHADKIVKADTMRRALEPALGRGILTAEGARWRTQRRVAAPVFRPVNVQSFVPAMLDGARATAARWAGLADGAQLDAGREMMHLTFEIILETMLSGRGNVDVEAMERSITDVLDATSWAIALSTLHAPDWTPFPGKGRAERGQAHMRGFVEKRVAERRASGERRQDLLSLMLDAVDPETGEGLTESDIVDNIITFIGAGHETTALALTWTFFLLSSHPEIEMKILAEIEQVTGGAELQADQVGSLIYTRQVIQESMRVYPPVAMVVREAIEPFTLDGATVHAGDAVFVPIQAIHHHRDLWDNPEVFDPDRFTPEASKGRHRFAFLPFIGGPRICIGMGFALLEAVAILAVLLPVARLVAKGGFKPTPKIRVTMRPAEGMPMTLKKRKTSAAF